MINYRVGASRRCHRQAPTTSRCDHSRFSSAHSRTHLRDSRLSAARWENRTLDDQRFHDGARFMCRHHSTEMRSNMASGCMMPLTLRPTGLGAGIDKDRPDYTIYSGGWAVGRIYETRGGPDRLRWFWSFTVTGPMTCSDSGADASCRRGSSFARTTSSSGQERRKSGCFILL